MNEYIGFATVCYIHGRTYNSINTRYLNAFLAAGKFHLFSSYFLTLLLAGAVLHLFSIKLKILMLVLIALEPPHNKGSGELLEE